MGKYSASRGQMLLVVVLTMIVALTVGLSIAARTITNLRISRQNEESQRAFQAAEAGIERALESGESFEGAFDANNSTFTTQVSTPQGTEFLLNAGENVDQDSGIDLWISDYPDYANPRTGNITVYWSPSASQTECSNTGADSTVSGLEVVVLSGSVTSPSISKFVFDDCGRIPNATVPGAGGAVSGKEFSFAAAIPVTNGLIARVIPLYNSSTVGITSTVALPEQGTVIESTGESGETVRKVQYFSSHPQVPLEIFPYSVVSQ